MVSEGNKHGHSDHVSSVAAESQFDPVREVSTETPHITDTNTPPSLVPDGGWGWAVVVISGLVFTWVICFDKTVTIFYQQLRLKFPESSSAETAAVMSIAASMRSFAGPLAAWLIHLIGNKAVGLLSCVLMVSSYMCAMFAPSVTFLYFTYAILKGLSIAMIVVTTYSMIATYFDKNKGKAMSLSSCFIAIGGLLAPLWLSKSYEEYGYFGTMIIMVGMSLHILPASLSFRPLKDDYDKQTVTAKGNVRYPGITTGPPEKQSKVLELDKTVTVELIGTGEVNTSDNGISQHASCSSEDNSVRGVKLAKTLNALNKFLLVSGLADLSSARVLCHMIMCISVAVVHGVSITFTAGLALEKGFATADVKFVVSFVYGAELLWKVGIGFLLDYFGDHRPFVYTTMTFLLGCHGIVLPLITHKALLIGIWIIFQGFLANAHTHAFTVVSDLVPRQRMTASLGLARFFMGFGYIIGPLTGGILRDKTASFALTYQVGGLQMIVISILVIVMDIQTAVSKCRLHRNQSEGNVSPE